MYGKKWAKNLDETVFEEVEQTKQKKNMSARCFMVIDERASVSAIRIVRDYTKKKWIKK